MYFYGEIHHLACHCQHIFHSVLRLDDHSNSLAVLEVNVSPDFPRVVSEGIVYCGAIRMQIMDLSSVRKQTGQIRKMETTRGKMFPTSK